jgi:F-type H+-transporting ATPase subunit gamma
LPAEEFLAGLIGHYLYAALNEVLYSSLMAENRQRHAHMDSALNKLDEDRAHLRLVYNALRQEDITEEIEVILLSAGMLEQEHEHEHEQTVPKRKTG